MSPSEALREMSARLNRLLPAIRQRGVLFTLAAAGAFLLFLRTLAPTVLPGDSGEFQFAAWGWTLVHPTGYPLYLILGGLWQHLVPVGDPAYRLNLLSAVLSALTVGLAYRVFYRVARNRGAAFVGAVTLAVAPTFWGQATETEVYALNTFFVVLLTYFALKWQARSELKYSAAWALTFGLALAHHRTTILLIHAFAVFFFLAARTRARDPRALPPGPIIMRSALYAALVAAPLLLYAYIPFRTAATPYRILAVSPAQTIVTFDNSPRGWIAYLAGSRFQSELGLDARSIAALSALPGRLIDQFNPVGFALGLLGLYILFYERRYSVAALSLLGFAGIALFDAVYHIGDIADLYTPAYFFFALWIAAGLGALLSFLRDRAPVEGSLLPAIVLLVALTLVPLQNLSTAFPRQDKSMDSAAVDRWRAVLASDIPADAILVSNDRDEMMPLWYLQIVEGQRRDLLGLFPLISPDPGYSNTVRLLDSVTSSGRPVFTLKQMPGLALRYRLDPAGPHLYHVASVSPPMPDVQSAAVVGDRLRVLGYSIIYGEPAPGSPLGITVYWQPLLALDRNYKTSLQLLDNAGNKVAQGDDHQPGGDFYPSSLWLPGETLRDEFILDLSPELMPGSYRLAVKVYDPQSEQDLGDLTQIGTLLVR